MELVNLDTKSIMGLLFWGNLFLTFLVFAYALSNATPENEKRFIWFSMAKLSETVGWFLIFLRGAIPHLLSINVANTLLVVGFYFESIVMLALLNSSLRKSFRLQFVLMVVTVILYNFTVLFFRLTPNVRVALVSLAIFVILLIPTVKYMRESQINLFKIAYSGNYVLVLLLLAHRAVYLLVTPIITVFTNSPVQSIFFLALFLLMVISGMGFLLLVKEKQEIQIQRLMNDKDRFFSIIAHDLRGPLSSIMGLSEHLSHNTNEYPIEEVQKMVSMLYDSSKNSYRLLENLLDWSRVQTGAMEFKPELFELNKLICENLELYQNTAVNKEILLKCESVEPIELEADRNMVDAILRNLIGNAIKFTKKGGTVTVAIQKMDKNIEISVADTGVGMDDRIKNKLFKISEKVSLKGTANEEGTGLGLLLCQEFVIKHHGKIWVESEVGKGSTFIVSLPLS